MESMNSRVAVIDDEPGIRTLLEIELADAGFDVRSAPDGIAGLALVREWVPDAVLLDVMMPKIDGLSLLPELRRVTQAPIFVVSAKGQTNDKVRGLESGADQYIAKPFEIPELVARIRSALRRPRLEAPEVIAFRDLSIDLQTRRVVRSGRAIDLTTREFDLLAAFVREPRRVFTRDQLISMVWGDGSAVTGNAVETYVSYLRHKIDYGFPEQLLHTIRGVGYCLRSTG
jgi:DNA-binding response OmpR family regulator